MPKEHTVIRRAAPAAMEQRNAHQDDRAMEGKIKDLKRKLAHAEHQGEQWRDDAVRANAKRLATHTRLWTAPLWQRIKYAVTGNPEHLGVER